MAVGPGSDDDDKAPSLPEVTVPPWLRTGPLADSSVVAASAGARSAVGTDGSETERAVPEEQDVPVQAPPTRITLGAQRRAFADDGPAAQGGPASSSSSRRATPARAATPAPAGPSTPASTPSPGGPSTPASTPVAGGAGERVVDDLSTLPLRTGAAATAPAAHPAAPAGGPAPGAPLLARRPVRIVSLVAAGIAVLGGSAVLGFVVARGASDPGPEPGAASVTPECVEAVGDGRVVGSGPGSLDSPAGAVLAFDHAYYVDRSAEKAFEAVAPSSRMTKEQLSAEGIDKVAEGTTHCVEVRELAPTLLEVDLTEFPPEADPVVIRQRIRVAELGDGTWGIVSITPAG